MDLVALASKLHEWLDLAVAAGAAGVIGLSVALLLGVERARFAIDWLIVGIAGVAVGGSIAGVVLLAGRGGPHDILHYLYAGLVLAAIPVARVVGSRSGSMDVPAGRLRHRRLAAWLIGGSLTTLAALLRLAATG